MQIWNVLHAARCKCRMQKSSKIWHLGTIIQLCRALSSQLRHVSTIGKKLVKQQYLLQMSSKYGILRPASGWDQFTSLAYMYPCKFQRLSHLGSITARQSCSERQPNFAPLNRGHHLCSAGRQSRWTLAHIVVGTVLQQLTRFQIRSTFCIMWSEHGMGIGNWGQRRCLRPCSGVCVLQACWCIC